MFPNAVKIYYGAGKRFYPTRYDNYNLFLVDSRKQLKTIRAKHKRAALFIKPAATLFKPVNVEKKYDICFVANAGQAKIKRHNLFLRAFAGSRFKILNLGNTNKKLIA